MRVLPLLLFAGCASAPGDPFAIARPAEMHAVCLRLVDVDGHIYERSAWFGDEGYKHALRFPGARAGGCWQNDEPHEVKLKADGKKPCASRRCNN